MGENLICLVNDCKNKNMQSLQRLVELFNPLIRKYEILLNYEDARYELQEKLITILVSFPRCTNEYEVLKYIKTSVHREYINLSRKKDLYEKINMSTDVFDEYVNSSSSDYELINLKQSLCTLTENQQKIIYYKYFYGYKVNQIAEKMGITRQAVHKSEQKALMFLKEKLVN